MKIGFYRFTPKPMMSMLYLTVGAAMFSLGVWQLQRASEKIHLQTMATQAGLKTPVALQTLDVDGQQSLFSRISLRGVFEPDRQLLWDNRISQGIAGYEVITPFRLTATGKLVLVNRGWMPLGASRETLPEIAFATSAESFITGIWSRPSIGFSGGNAVDLNLAHWPRVLQHFSFDEIAQAIGEPVLPGLVQISREPAVGKVMPGVPTSVPMYRDNWQPVANGPERHYGYAFQWFAMLFALTILFVCLNTQKLPDEQKRMNRNVNKST